MATSSFSFFLNSLTNGSGARLALGSTVFVYLIAFNETTSLCVIVAIIVATIYTLLSGRCRHSLKGLQMPYIRANNKFDYICLYLATWMDTLAVLCACASLARTLSICLDAMTGGLARIMILGRNSSPNEPWPDVLGVAVVFLVTGMFMLGLENSKAFSVLMALAMFGLNAILSAVSWWNGTTIAWHETILQPDGIKSLFVAIALLTFCFPAEYMITHNSWQRFIGLIIIILTTLSLLLTGGCLTTLVSYRSTAEYVALPLFKILDENNFHKLIPAAACLLMLTVSGAFLELFPELYGYIVKFATSEWKILPKQISYESTDSGNPVLAIFIGGSLCAMLAFACPLQNLIYILAASHLCGILWRAFYLLYMPFRPKFIQQINNESLSSSLSYSRLSTVPTAPSSSSNSKNSTSRLKRSLWNISNITKHNSSNKQKQKTQIKKNKREVEKEWLLLGEPNSPCPQREVKPIESTALSDGEPPPSDFEYSEKFENTDSETSTDIDAIVDEYRQKIKVTTSGTLEHVPSITSWRIAIFILIIITSGILVTIVGLFMHWTSVICTSSIGVFVLSLIMCFIPKYSGSIIYVSPVITCLTLLMGSILLAVCLSNSWPALIFWLSSGLILLIRCNSYCCCLYVNERTTVMTEQLLPSVSSKTAITTTTIRIPRPPKGLITTIPHAVNTIR